MSLYFVTALTNATAMYAKATEVYGEAALFQLREDKFFVHTDDTSMEVSSKLGIRGAETGNGLVLRVTTYNGRATSSLWEWLAARLEE